jgi:hypothetical protein
MNRSCGLVEYAKMGNALIFRGTNAPKIFDTSALWRLFEQEQAVFFYAFTDVREAFYPRGSSKPIECFTELLDTSETVIKTALLGNRDFSVDETLLPFVSAATAFKHQGFYEEREVRLVAMAGTELAAEMERKAGRTPPPLKEVGKTSRGGRERRHITLFGKDFARLPRLWPVLDCRAEISSKRWCAANSMPRCHVPATRSLADEPTVRLILDGTVVRVRLDRKATSISLLVVLGVRRDGQKVLLAIKQMGGESTAAWRTVLDDLIKRGLRRPELLIVDGGTGLESAIAAVWDGVPVQRCTVHKHRNLLAHAPERLREVITADYNDMIYAATREEIETRRKAFIRKWRLKHRAVADSLEEAGDRLFTFTRLPAGQWRSMRTTNAIERLHEEFNNKPGTPPR